MQSLSVLLIKDSALKSHQSYSAVSTRSSIFELTNSKMRFSAVFLLFLKCSVALSLRGPPAEVDERARINSCSSS